MRYVMACLSALVLMMTLGSSARAEVIQKTDAGFIVSSSADVAGKSPAEVWKALLEPQKWWASAHTWSGDAAHLYMDAQAGGCLCELLLLAKNAAVGSRRGSVEHARIINAMPGRMLRMSGAFGPLQGEAVVGTVTIKLKASESGTRITWEYVVGGFMRMKADDIVPMVDNVVSLLTQNLGAYAENMPKENDSKIIELGDDAKTHQ